jgi:hypothetical protein
MDAAAKSLKVANQGLGVAMKSLKVANQQEEKILKQVSNP